MNEPGNSKEALWLDHDPQSIAFSGDSAVRAWPWWRWSISALCLVALAISAYLSWLYLANGSVIGCAGGSPCDQVLRSRWSTIGGVVPISGLAMGAFLALLIASFFIGPRAEPQVRRLAWRAMLVLVGAAAGSAVWFTILQKRVIGAFCPYCMATHTIGIALAALVVWRATRQTDDSAPRRMIGLLPVVSLFGGGLALAGVLAVSQIKLVPPAEFRAGAMQDNKSVTDFRSMPLIGSPEAQTVVTLLFDYKCPHCQQLHFMLNEVVRRYDGKLAFALCPTPLNTRCNPYIPRDVDAFKDSCELARMGMAVWRAKRETFPAFELWMFTMESGDRWQPRELNAAKAKAIELVGQAKFEAAWNDPWIDKHQETSMRIFGDTARSGNLAIPKMVFGSRWVVPQPNDADELIQILQDSLGMPKP